MAIVLIAAGLLCLWLGLHPFTTYPLSLVLAKVLRPKPLPLPLAADGAGKPDVNMDGAPEMAMLLCAYNEEGVIEAKARNMVALKRAYPKLELMIYVDCAADRTAELLEPFRDEIHVHVNPERMGKTYGMNLLMSRVRAPIVIFTDANVMIDEAAPARLTRYFADETIGCVCGHLRYTNSNASITASSGSLYWRLDEWTKRLETATGSAMGADGSLFAIRRELHRPTPVDMFDDIYVSMMILCEGHRLVQADDVIALEESVPVQREEFARKIRIGCQAYNAHLLLWPSIKQIDAFSIYKYVSHKWLRWLTIYFLIAAALLVEAGLLVAGAAIVAYTLAALGVLCLVAGYFSITRPLTQIWDILLAFAGTGLGVLKSLRGHRFQTWTPAASLRK
jgi:cellulose synthase/poly-beta-1,6-N-acetylglucosamine synthase-like glycosyltransferase